VYFCRSTRRPPWIGAADVLVIGEFFDVR